MDCRRFGVLRPAGSFARALFSGAGREFFPAVRQGTSYKTFSAYITAGISWAGFPVQYFAQAETGHSGNLGNAAAGPVYWPGGWGDAVAEAARNSGIAIQNVVLSAASGADNDRVGVAILANRADAKVGPRGDRPGSTGVSDSRARSETMAVRRFAAGSQQFTVRIPSCLAAEVA